MFIKSPLSLVIFENDRGPSWYVCARARNAQHRCFSASTVDEITPCTRPPQLLEKVLVDSLDLKSVLDSTSDIVADHEFG
jgi:hypothetical protein